MIADVYGTLKEGLKEKLGCVLFQLPPRLAYNSERLHLIAESMDPAFDNVLECRHESWWNEEVYSVLSKHRITFCGMSHPDLPADVISSGPNVYYRFHGVPHLYASLYSLAGLKKILATINAGPQNPKVFVYFNNDIGGSALTNATQLNQLIKKIDGTA